MDFGDAVLSHMGLQREVSVHVKNESPRPHAAVRDHSGLEPNHNNTKTHRH